MARNLRRALGVLIATLVGSTVLAVPAGATLPVPTCAAHFTDIPAETYYSEPVAWLSDEAITTGTTLTTFSPENTLTRGEFATFLWRYAGLPGVTITGEFTDVPTGAFYEIAVYWMLEQGITTGKTATMFAPDDPVTRSELATFLWRYAGLPGATITGEFSDVPTGAFYEIAVYWMLDEGITTGTSTTTYSPNDPVTRAQLSAFLWRYDDEPLAECLDESVGTNATLAANTEALVAANEGAYPWLRDAWNYAQVYMSVASKQLSDDFAGIVVSDCTWTATTLPECRAETMTIDPDWLGADHVLIHELAHVYDLTSHLTVGSTWASARVYMSVTYDSTNCDVAELVADAMTHLVDDSLYLYYYEDGCNPGHTSPTAESETLINDSLANAPATWPAATYTDGAAFWAALLDATDDFQDDDEWYFLRALDHPDFFGGFCWESLAMSTFLGIRMDDNPFADDETPPVCVADAI